MSGRSAGLAAAWLSLACVPPQASGQPVPVASPAAVEQPADSLAAALDRLEPSDLQEALAWLDAESAGEPGNVDEARPRRSGGGLWRVAARSTAAGGRWELGRRSGLGEFRLRGGDGEAPSGGIGLQREGASVLAGDLSLQAGLGLLLSGAGSWAGPSTPGGLQGGVRAGLHPGAAERRGLRGIVAAGWVGPVGVTAWRGRARDAAAASRTGAALTCAAGGGQGSFAVASEGGSGGASLSAAWTGGDLTLAGEGTLWGGLDGGSRRAAWVLAGRWRAGRRATAEVQVAAAQPGIAPRGGQRAAALVADEGRGWLLRVQGRSGGMKLAASCGAAAHDAWSEGTPRLTDVRRWSLEAESGDGRRRGGASLQGRAETRRGWADRMPWLPPALLSRQEVWRAAAWFETVSGPWRGRVAWRTVRTVARDPQGGGDDDRSALSVSVGAAPPDGWGWRFVQVWAWGGGADLLSVESPAPGLVLPRHWGRWRDEQTLGLHWRRGGAGASFSVSCRRPQQSQAAADCEVRAAAALDWRGP
ncbi:MAG: hypothetical protein IPH09_00890 [bacterium]|nr:hypothetical protein [bacterium]